MISNDGPLRLALFDNPDVLPPDGPTAHPPTSAAPAPNEPNGYLGVL
jgi:hypothetical protein